MPQGSGPLSRQTSSPRGDSCRAPTSDDRLELLDEPDPELDDDPVDDELLLDDELLDDELLEPLLDEPPLLELEPEGPDDEDEPTPSGDVGVSNAHAENSPDALNTAPPESSSRNSRRAESRRVSSD